MPETKAKVYEFTVTVVTDVTHMAEAFGTNPVTGDTIMVQCWDDLVPYRWAFPSPPLPRLILFRDLVNEICEWANKKLVSHAKRSHQPRLNSIAD